MMFNLHEWADDFFSQPVEGMSKDLSEIFLRMSILEREEKLNLVEIKEKFLYKVIDQRAKFIGLEVSEPLKIFLMFLSQNPGTAVMYLYALRSKFASANIETLANMFPIGFLKESALEEMWVKQKAGPENIDIDNYLDKLTFR